MLMINSKDIKFACWVCWVLLVNSATLNFKIVKCVSWWGVFFFMVCRPWCIGFMQMKMRTNSTMQMKGISCCECCQISRGTSLLLPWAWFICQETCCAFCSNDELLTNQPHLRFIMNLFLHAMIFSANQTSKILKTTNLVRMQAF